MVVRDRFPRTKNLLPLDVLLYALIDNHHLWPIFRAHRVLTEWKALVGPSIARVTAPDGLRNGVLSVWVKTSPWMQELRMLSARVIADINAGIGGDPPLVRELRLHFGSSRIIADDDHLAQLRRDLERRRPPPRLIPVAAVGPRAEAIQRDAAIVEDAELRELISAVRLRHDR